jgi:phospholipid-transporting ATPase
MKRETLQESRGNNRASIICANTIFEKRKSANQVPVGKIRVFFGENNVDKIKNKKFPNNTINTTKYNLFTFLPKSLIFQFRRAANIYFLIISVLTCFWFSPKQPSSMIGTFAFVLFATMIKEAIEDYSRYKQDCLSNDRKVEKYINGKWNTVKCWTLRPGDLIHLKKEEEFSADTLILRSSNDSGYCFIDTKNLDGETNLKETCALEEFKNKSLDDLQDLCGNIICDEPDENLKEWNGTMILNGERIYASLKNIILKGCTLKNTDGVYGIVIYSGHNTKIMKNSKKPRQKISRVMLIMNKLLYSLFAVDIIICVIFGSFSFNFVKNHGPKYTYIFPEYDPTDYENLGIVRFGFNFLTFFVAYSQIIPISLYVALEVVKIFQGILIYYDNEIYDIELKKPALCRTSDLIEELGQVEFVFSDKTGTLTQNSMILKKCFVDGKIYGQLQTETEDAQNTINGDRTVAEKLKSTDNNDLREKSKLKEFFNLLAICHNVFPDLGELGDITYQGSSPDEIALVKGASQIGIKFIDKKFTTITIINSYTNESANYEVRQEMPFNSDRKRMSVVIKDLQTNQYSILSKGADNVMLGTDGKIPIVTHFSNPYELENTKSVLKAFSKEGLRILVMGKKDIEENKYKEWEKRYNLVQSSEKKDYTEVFAELEKDLQFIGCSAIEDKLQEGVPETIHTLLQCGIRVWVLTGDKQDTAIEIAKSCRLIDETMNIVDLSTDPDMVEKRIKEVAQQLKVDNFQDEKNNVDLENVSHILKESAEKDISIVIDGTSLSILLENEELRRLFFLVSIAAKSVLCCRVTPKEKANVVNLVKSKGKWITLSIGDGANDVPMIMEAHIGIGVMGKEGTQAVRSADYAIGQFRFLEKLILVYGRNGYIKITKFICYYFYKNILLVFTELFFAYFNGFSGQIFFADYLSTMYNAFFTSWPCVFTFSLEREHNLNICKKFPILYKAGPKNYYFNFKTFWMYIFYAILHSVLSFFIPSITLSGELNQDGLPYNHWRISTLVFCVVIHVVTIKLLLISEFWNILNLLASVTAIAFYYVVLFVLCSETFAKNFQIELLGVASDVLKDSKGILIIIITPFVCITFDILFKQVMYNILPHASYLIHIFKNTAGFKSVMLVENSSINRFNDNSHKSNDIRNSLISEEKIDKKKRNTFFNYDNEHSQIPLKDKNLNVNNIINLLNKSNTSSQKNGNDTLANLQYQTKLKMARTNSLNSSNYEDKEIIFDNDLQTNKYLDRMNPNQVKNE